MLKKMIMCVAVAGLILALAPAAQAQPYGTWPMATVPVGHTGNTADDTGYGAVGYEYNIGTYEVTSGQYADFLNAAATSDPHGLWNSFMNDPAGTPATPRVSRTGSDGSYEYAVAADYANRPMGGASWYATAMFCNWLTSGDIHQGAYDTSPGANWGDGDATQYTGVTPRNQIDALGYDKVYAIPTEDEWYKAAYHMNNGDTGGAANYYDYATSSDTLPGFVKDPNNYVTEPYWHSNHPGNVFVEGGVDPGNYATSDYVQGEHGWDDGPYFKTEVGEWENSVSPYGTFDQTGNIWEWNEDVFGAARGRRGGYFAGGGGESSANARYNWGPTQTTHWMGFRVVEFVGVTDVPGDLSGDGDVDLEDVGLFEMQFGSQAPGAYTADFDADGDVDLEDFLVMRDYYGTGVIAPEPAATPEPASAVSLLLGLGAVIRRRRSCRRP